MVTGSGSDAPAGYSALVVGATGLVGGHLVRTLLADPAYGRVSILARRPYPDGDIRQRLDERIVDFEALDRHPGFAGGDHIFCALGTTIRKAGSRDRFRRVDLDYTRRVAELAHGNGARHFSLVSATGASADSWFFYNRVKGEVEAAVSAVGIPSVTILRPSVLGGDREERRATETIGQLLLRFVPGRLRLVEAEDVARVMVRLARREEPGERIVESEEIRRLAGAVVT